MSTQVISYAGVSPHRSKSLVRERVFATSTSVGPLLLRLTLALVMFPHGAQKMLGWFGGYGFSGTMDGMTKMGLPAVVVLFVICTEFFGPLLLILGLGTRVVALGFVGLMVGAITTVHAKNGFFMDWFGQQHAEGYEYHLLVIGIALALIVMGGGKLALDRGIAQAGAR